MNLSMEANANKAAKTMRDGFRTLFRRKSPTIRRRLIVCFVLIVILMIAADGVAVWQFRRITAAAQRLSKLDETTLAVVRIHFDVATYRDRMDALPSTHDTRQLAIDLTSVRQKFLQHADYAQEVLSSSLDVRTARFISSALESLRGTLLSQVDTALELARGGEWNAVRRRLAIQIPALVEFSSSLVGRVDEEVSLQRTVAIHDTQRAQERLLIIVPIAALLALLVATALGWYVTQSISAPLSELTKCADALARKNFDSQVQVCGDDELAVLGKAFNYAAQQLQKLYEDLRRSEGELREVVEAMPTMVWMARTDGSNEFGNRRWQEYTGLSHERTIGSGWQDAVHPADLKQHWEKWCVSRAGGEPFENEVRYRRASDGQYRWFLSRAVPLRDEHGKILKWYGVSTDIDDRKRAEQEREQLRADLAHVNRIDILGELAASVSHELKQPIAAAMTNARTCIRWLKRDEPDVHEALEAIMRIVKDGARATEIIDRLRSLYKKSPPQRELVDTSEIVREMLALLRGEANRYSIVTRSELAPDIPKVTADRVQLQQVFMNLMLNAIEAMKDAGGELTIKTERGQEGSLLISVRDTGVGLPPEKTDEIFNAFFTTKPEGSGMGLAISRSIIESHGGRLWAIPNDSRGATFQFTLPVVATESASAA